METARKIKALPDIHQPRLFLTSYATKRLEKKGLADEGFERQLLKPIYRDHLLRALTGASETQESLAPAAGNRFSLEEARAISDLVVENLSILLAEDNKMNQKVAINMLKKLGHTVTVAQNGKEAVDLYQKGGFHLILMDGQMPEMDGMEATRAIRALEAAAPDPNARIPILALTANAMKGDRERFSGLRHGRLYHQAHQAKGPGRCDSDLHGQPARPTQANRDRQQGHDH